MRVYPRGCGGTSVSGSPNGGLVGLSPRVRGNRCRARWTQPPRRSIPAGAGEPPGAAPGSTRHGVYPRGCGGTSQEWWGRLEATGLSPRVRGNLLPLRARRCKYGSIPAGAGEPPGLGRARRRGEVYPRGCGGTPGVHGVLIHAPGLSPRVRGNLRLGSRAAARSGSIPAGAGEPPPPAVPSRPTGVYPRGCGGTPAARGEHQRVQGLSPRVRGNRQAAVRPPFGVRSIPAGAGEPRPSSPTGPTPTVYPRGCGGTLPAAGVLALSAGLSPRVRGNRRLDPQPVGGLRSIPAGAGEPSGSAHRRTGTWVYPRGCGGTSMALMTVRPDSGLSPRVRGNPPEPCVDPEGHRSIPAGAGEPA